MATVTLPPLEQIAGKQYKLYDAYYHQIILQLGNPSVNDQLTIPALDAAKFLKKSSLSDAILSRIWDLCDYNSKGVLDKSGFFLALRLIAHAQNGLKVDIQTIAMSGPNDVIPEPKIMGGPPPMPQQQAQQMDPQKAAKMQLWKAKFLQLSSSSPTGKIPGAIAKPLLMDSKLPIDKLGQIWDLSDVDKDGELSETEFYTCLDLIERMTQQLHAQQQQQQQQQQQESQQQQQQSQIIPPVQPPQQTSPIIRRPSLAQEPTPTNSFVVTTEMSVRYETMFKMADADRDGFVNGLEIKDLFLQSGLNQTVLAQIWNLADTGKSGKLTFEEFTVSMWFIESVLRESKNPSSTFKLPNQLEEYPNMIDFIQKRTLVGPGPGRVSVSGGGGSITSSRKSSISAQSVVLETVEQPSSECQLVQKEIHELNEERQKWQYEIMARESEKKVKQGEVASLNSELDTLSATLKQLENQKSLAGTKLGELEAQVINLRSQHATQEEILTKTESENQEKSNELSNLELEQIQIETELGRITKENEMLNEKQTNYNLNFNHFTTRKNDLDLLKETMQNLIEKYAKCIENGDFYTLTENDLRDLGFELEEFEIEYDKLNRSFNENHLDDENSSGKPDPFAAANNNNNNGANAGVGGHQDFSQTNSQSWNEPSSTDNQHHFAAGSNQSWDTPFGQPADPFAAPVSAARSPGQMPKSPAGDAFGHEPFAAPTPTMSDHGHAPNAPPVPLPPKKVPPSRPAPPKMGPARPPPPKKAQTPTPDNQPASEPPPADDNFANFADFANFDDQSTSRNRFKSSSSISSSNNNNAKGGGGWKLNLRKNSSSNNNSSTSSKYDSSSSIARKMKPLKINDNFSVTTFSNSSNNNNSDTINNIFAANNNNTTTTNSSRYNFNNNKNTLVENRSNNNTTTTTNMNKNPLSSISSTTTSTTVRDNYEFLEFKEDPFKNYEFVDRINITSDMDFFSSPQTQTNSSNNTTTTTTNRNQVTDNFTSSDFFFNSDANDPFK